MAKVIANELERFRRDIKEAQQKIQELQDTYNTMFDEITALTGMWEGEAHDVYMEQFHTDSENMKLVLNNLKAYKKSMDEAYRKFRICEQQVEDTIRRVQV